jgi:hypothetical protein
MGGVRFSEAEKAEIWDALEVAQPSPRMHI